MSLVLPANVMRERMVDKTIDAIPYWNKLLKQIDENLSLVFASEKANAPGLVPGRFHVRRRNPDGLDSYKPIVLSDGGFRPMASDILDELRAQDLWRGDVADRIFNEQVRREAEAERDRARHREGLKDEFATNFKALTSPSMLVNTDVPFKNKAKARRDKKET